MPVEDNTSWVTSDCGETLALVGDGKEYSDFKFNPSNSSLVIGLQKFDCKMNDSSIKVEGCSSSIKLAISKDGGHTFKVVRENVTDADWVKHSDFRLDLGNQAIISQEIDDSSLENIETQTNIPRTASIYFSWDLFATSTQIAEQVNKYWLTKCCLFVEFYADQFSKALQMTDVSQNVFHWLPVTFDGHYSLDLFDFKIVQNLDSFTVIGQLTTAIHNQ